METRGRIAGAKAVTHVRRYVVAASEPFVWLSWCGERNPASSISTTFIDEVAAAVVMPMAPAVEICPDCLLCMAASGRRTAPDGGHG